MNRILIVEDDLIISKNIQEALLSEQFDLEAAFDGTMAEKLLKRNFYDCIVMDINLPHINGYELCRMFRQYNTTTPILFLTAFDELEDKVQGYDSGADDYLTKPFFMKELILRINSLIKRSRQLSKQNESEVVVFEDIVINQRTKTVRRNNKELELTPREFQILLRLVRAQGELVLKKELIREIWGSSFDANTNTIEVYINFLRNKVDKPFATPLIKTKIGYGYYLESDK